MSDDQKPAAPKPRVVRCAKCKRYLCSVSVTMEVQPVGPVAAVKNLKCHCGHNNDFSVEIKDREDGSGAAKAAN